MNEQNYSTKLRNTVSQFTETGDIDVHGETIHLKQKQIGSRYGEDKFVMKQSTRSFQKMKTIAYIIFDIKRNSFLITHPKEESKRSKSLSLG